MFSKLVRKLVPAPLRTPVSRVVLFLFPPLRPLVRRMWRKQLKSVRSRRGMLKRDLAKNLGQRKTKTEKLKADNSKNLMQHTLKIEKLTKRLYALGFTERALEDLQNLVTYSSEPTL